MQTDALKQRREAIKDGVLLTSPSVVKCCLLHCQFKVRGSRYVILMMNAVSLNGCYSIWRSREKHCEKYVHISNPCTVDHSKLVISHIVCFTVPSSRQRYQLMRKSTGYEQENSYFVTVMSAAMHMNRPDWH